ncbi:ASCH domain-containing protein [Enterococcus hirae]|nr:ASCH domain-containing protein [Enterococcus hirae]
MPQSIEKIWQDFQKAHALDFQPLNAYSFGRTPKEADETLALVLQGKKRASTSNYTLYFIEQSDLPQVGQYNVILDSLGEARAITQTKAVEIIPLSSAGAMVAYLQGEDPANFEKWRKRHVAFFKQESEKLQFPFREDMPIVVEIFEVAERVGTAE